VTEAELIELLTELPDTDVPTAVEASGAPAWGELLGYAPGAAPAGIEQTVFDTVLPHPVYTPHAFVCVVNPGEQARALIEFAHARAATARA
jgi:hypothetical protein